MRSELSRSHIKNQRSPPLAQNETLGDWYALWLVFITNLTAFVGRFVPEDTIPKSSATTTSFVLVRVLFIPGIFVAVQHRSVPFSLRFESPVVLGAVERERHVRD